jgi:hypothetical protein
VKEPAVRASRHHRAEIKSNCYYTTHLADLYTYDFSCLGTRADGNDGGTFLIAVR